MIESIHGYDEWRTSSPPDPTPADEARYDEIDAADNAVGEARAAVIRAAEDVDAAAERDVAAIRSAIKTLTAAVDRLDECEDERDGLRRAARADGYDV